MLRCVLEMGAGGSCVYDDKPACTMRDSERERPKDRETLRKTLRQILRQTEAHSELEVNHRSL